MKFLPIEFLAGVLIITTICNEFNRKKMNKIIVERSYICTEYGYSCVGAGKSKEQCLEELEEIVGPRKE